MRQSPGIWGPTAAAAAHRRVTLGTPASQRDWGFPGLRRSPPTHHLPMYVWGWGRSSANRIQTIPGTRTREERFEPLNNCSPTFSSHLSPAAGLMVKAFGDQWFSCHFQPSEIHSGHGPSVMTIWGDFSIPKPRR